MNKLITFILLVIGCMLISAEGRTQDTEIMRSVMDGKERACLDCHRYPNINANEGVLASQSLCLECHGKELCKKMMEKKEVPLQVSLESFDKTRHKYTACIHCHTDVARSPHHSETGAECLGCHSVHGEGEGKIHDPHLRVQCQACHRTSKFVTLDREIDRIRLSHFDDKKVPISLTDHALPDVSQTDFCKKCHNAENKVGAAATILPSKSFLCILCHNAPLNIGNPIFWVAFLIFILGIVLTLRFWFKGSVKGEEKSLHRKISLTSESMWQLIFTREIFFLVKVVILDVVFQRRILQESVKRWSIHSLIYLSILARLFLGLFTYFTYRIAPDSPLAFALINKNHGFTAFIYDLLGFFIVLGIVWAIIQRFIIKPVYVAKEGQDIIGLSIIGVLILLGFLLESVRILMTQIPPEVAIYSFIGYPVAKLISYLGLNWKIIYPYLWYAHAIVGALFIAYLPFGKMKHIFNTPLTLVMNYKLK
ncbi:MAG: respiratory nitrate reductase subunit gamma [Desulfobacteraceae bacterium]|nr:respiratory nitrate reductase subunit gamma [Desulfobacteraceae bacterium]